MEGVIYCFLKGDIWGWAEQEGVREGKGGAQQLKSTLIEHLVNKMDGPPSEQLEHEVAGRKKRKKPGWE